MYHLISYNLPCLSPGAGMKTNIGMFCVFEGDLTAKMNIAVSNSAD